MLLDTEQGPAPRAPEHKSVVSAALTGAGAGIVGSAVMAVVFKAGDKLLLPERQITGCRPWRWSTPRPRSTA